MLVQVPEDADLVALSLAGNRDAFGQIVSRYQSLICSLAYSATGNLGESEDLAQETFITAWKHLRHLREQNKLRAWLYGIARNRINNSLRRGSHKPLRVAEPLEAAHESESAEPLPREQVISREEEAILWRALERIDETYREPLVLFYREHQSIENVAAALELSEDAVKQRLSRGRKLLAEEVTDFVEGALERTTPGKAFTVGVLAALPVTMTTSAKAAMLAAAATKGSLAAKTAAGLGVFTAVINPLICLAGPWVQYRIVLKAAQSDQERAEIKRGYRQMIGLMLGFGLLLLAFVIFGGEFMRTHPILFGTSIVSFIAAGFGIVIAAYIGIAVRIGVLTNRTLRKFRCEQEARDGAGPARPAWEYRSRFELLGLPFIHIRLSASAAGRTPVKAWIACGDFAFGVLFAFGGLAIAPVSIGGIAIGLMPWGGLAAGIFTMGGLALGVWSFGGIALGWQAFGGCALGWHAAMGGLALARDFAVGGLAQAAQANNAITAQFIDGSFFFQRMITLSRYIGWLNLLWFFPLAGLWKMASKRPSQGSSNS
jgi:RNA polymerase sigma factor (sigma-70 family)